MALNKVKGDYGEKLAQDYLLTKGYKILETNFRYSHKEIDIVAQDGEYIVFVEVKYRKNLEYGTPLEAINTKKMMQIRKVAEYYVYINEYRGCVRFDCIGILDQGNIDIKHIVNAF
ncbi:MAG: YraN family protein [Lachnospirales bacterium]